MGKENHIKVYLTSYGDMWDMIAKKTLGDEKYTKHLLDANPEYLKIVIFPEDVAIKIPEVDVLEVGEMPSWMI